MSLCILQGTLLDNFLLNYLFFLTSVYTLELQMVPMVTSSMVNLSDTTTNKSFITAVLADL